MNHLRLVTVYLQGHERMTFADYQSDHRAEAEIIKLEIDLIDRHLIDGQSVSTKLTCIMISGDRVILEYLKPRWSRKIDAERLKSNLETNASKISLFKFTEHLMKIYLRLGIDAHSIEKDYRRLLDCAAPCMKRSDAVLGFIEDSNKLGIKFSDLSINSPMMIAGYAGSGKTEMIISMLHSMMQHEKPRDLQFALIDQDVDEIISRLDLRKSGYIDKFACTDLRNRGNVHDILAAVLEEIDRRKFLRERFDKVVTYKGMIDQWCQIVVVIDHFELFQYSRYEIMSLIRKIAEADRSLNVRLIMTTHEGRLAEFLGTHTAKEYFKKLYDLNVNTLVRVENDQSSGKSRHTADLFSNEGFRRASVETIKLSKEN